MPENYGMADPMGEYAAGLGQRTMIAQGTDPQWQQDYANYYNRFLTDQTNGGLWADFSTRADRFDYTDPQSYNSATGALYGANVYAGAAYDAYNRRGSGGGNNVGAWRATMAADARERGMVEANRDMPAEIMAQIQRSGMDRSQIQFLRDQYKNKGQRDNMSKRVQGYYNDPMRDAKLAGQRQKGLDNQLSGIASQYNQARVGSAQQMASQGLQGSSVDVQRRGDLTRAKAGATAGAQDQMFRQGQDQKRIDQGQLGSMMSLINSDNPNTVRSVQAQLDGLDDQGQMYEQLMANSQQSQQASQFGNQMYSQVAGQTLSGLATAARQYGGTQGYGQGY